MTCELVLGIETGIGGGSVSILKDSFEKDSFEIDFWKGDSKISKSEDLLSNISDLLDKNNLSKKDIKKIAVSRGPGSFTGVRIGIATARGLQKALKCECRGISVLEALVLKTEKKGRVITGFGLGKNEVCWQSFELQDRGSILPLENSKISTVVEFAARAKNFTGAELILTSDLICKIRDSESFFEMFEKLNLKEFDENHARYIGLRSLQIFSDEDILPIYARDMRNA